MIFGGLQKLTLLDFPEKTACTVFTVGCNYRCPFCHNASLVCPGAGTATVDEGEILDFLSQRRGLLDGVCVTGGEPLLHQGLTAFLARVKALGFAVKLDTNGSNPQALKRLVSAGLIDYVAMDVKNTPEKYAQTTGVPDCDTAPVAESIAFLLSGALPYEFRTTVVREFHTEDDLVAVARWIAGAQRYFLQSFRPGDSVIMPGLHPHSSEELARLLTAVQAVLPVAELRGG